jgi:drug/metabolite transporter (DMT)-like permease
MSADIIEPKPLAGVLRGFLTGLAGLLYAFLIWTAVFYAIQLSSGDMTPYGWAVLLLPAVVTAVVFAVAFVIARRRAIGAFVLVLLAGLGLSAVFLLNTFSFVIRNLSSLTGS